MAANKSIPADILALGDATMKEAMRLIYLNKRITTLDKWIKEREGFVTEKTALLADIASRVETTAPEA